MFGLNQTNMEVDTIIKVVLYGDFRVSTHIAGSMDFEICYCQLPGLFMSDMTHFARNLYN